MTTIQRLRARIAKLEEDVQLWRERTVQGAEIIEGNLKIIAELRAENQRLRDQPNVSDVRLYQRDEGRSYQGEDKA